jgi:hypothetical protein
VTAPSWPGEARNRAREIVGRAARGGDDGQRLGRRMGQRKCVRGFWRLAADGDSTQRIRGDPFIS